MLGFFKKKNSTKKISCSAIIIATGNGNEYDEYQNMQFAEVSGKPVLAYTLECYENCGLIDEVIIVTDQENIVYCSEDIVKPYEIFKVKSIIGGMGRMDSVYNGLKEASRNTNVILIQDGPWPMISVDVVENLINDCIEYNAAASGVKVKEDIRLDDDKGFVVAAPQKDRLWFIQNPRAFEYNLIMNIYEKAIGEKVAIADELSLVESFGVKVKISDGSYENIRINSPVDIAIAESILLHRENN